MAIFVLVTNPAASYTRPASQPSPKALALAAAGYVATSHVLLAAREQRAAERAAKRVSR